jgi:site-specific DNA-methyltransferase (adenine-specific)
MQTRERRKPDWKSRDGRVRLYRADCLKFLPTMAENSVDAIVTDPPYHLTSGKKGGRGAASLNVKSPAGRARISTGFMGQAWDGGDIAFRPETWAELLRVAKPGAMLLAFGGTRTFHRMMVAIEDAGWEIRDTLMWVYGSGFPKSLDISKAIDKAAGAKRKPGKRKVFADGTSAHVQRASGGHYTRPFQDDPAWQGQFESQPATAASAQWSGWGTALKPAWEPIILAMKPVDGTFAENARRWGVAGLNIDACRIGTTKEIPGSLATKPRGYGGGWGPRQNTESGMNPNIGRWPANLIHDGSPEVLHEFPIGHSGGFPSTRGPGGYRGGWKGQENLSGRRFSVGSQARFFYCAKASRSEREYGVRGAARGQKLRSAGTQSPGTFQAEGTDRTSTNPHPTVKPIALMRYLCRLVTRPGGLVLDPFMGSGSTGIAALTEGLQFLGIERERKYFTIAKKRIQARLPARRCNGAA